MKDDKNKLRWHLVPMDVIEEVAEVIEYGARKYEPDDWKKQEDFDNRYYSAAMRHIMAWEKGECTDEESGLSHLAHAMCCLLFLRWHEKNYDCESEVPIKKETNDIPSPLSLWAFRQELDRMSKAFNSHIKCTHFDGKGVTDENS